MLLHVHREKKTLTIANEFRFFGACNQSSIMLFVHNILHEMHTVQ